MPFLGQGEVPWEVFRSADPTLRCPGRDRDTGTAHPTGTAAGNSSWGGGKAGLEGGKRWWQCLGAVCGQRNCVRNWGFSGARRPGVKGSRGRHGAGRLSELPSCLHAG